MWAVKFVGDISIKPKGEKKKEKLLFMGVCKGIFKLQSLKWKQECVRSAWTAQKDFGEDSSFVTHAA